MSRILPHWQALMERWCDQMENFGWACTAVLTYCRCCIPYLVRCVPSLLWPCYQTPCKLAQQQC